MDVFISHVEEDAIVALQIGLGLEARGYGAWCYEVDSAPGPSYLLQTGRAIADTRVLVLLITKRSLGSRQMTRELVRAHECEKDVIPVLYGLTHAEFQTSHLSLEWREALGAAASTSMPVGDVSERSIDHIAEGLRALGVEPGAPAHAERLAKIESQIHQRRQPAGQPTDPVRHARAIDSHDDRSRFDGSRDLDSRQEPHRADLRTIVRPAMLAVLIVAAIALAGWVLWPRGPLRIGVMQVSKQGDVPGWMGSFTRNSLNALFSQMHGIGVFSKDEIDWQSRHQDMSEVEVARKLGITKMISTTIMEMESRLTLNVEVIDASTALVDHSYQVSGLADQVITLQNDVVRMVMRGLGVMFDEKYADEVFAARTDNIDTLQGSKRFTEAFMGDPEPGPSLPSTPRKDGKTGWLGPRAAYAGDDEERAVRTLLDEYRKALEKEDIERIATIQMVSDSQRQAITRYFENADALQVTFSDVDVIVEGAQALATFTRSDDFKDAQSGRTVHIEVRMSSELAKQKDGWRIKGLRKPS